MADTLTLLQPPLPAPAQEMAGAIRDQAMRLHSMVSNLLDMARLQSGQQAGQLPLRLEWQPIEEVIGASIQLLGHSLHGHRITVQLPDTLPLVAIDAVLMERVFGNLLENASKYALPGSDIPNTPWGGVLGGTLRYARLRVRPWHRDAAGRGSALRGPGRHRNRHCRPGMVRMPSSAARAY